MKLTMLAVFVLTIFVSGCATTEKPMYDYGTYSESFYAMKKDAGAETVGEWKMALENIINESNQEALRVPPGVYANLGYIHLKANNTEKAISYFEQEQQTYPESEIFMSNLIKKSNLQGNDKL
ncbi:DUF4810 domain-containing protein [Psychromonas arctica]|uniref:DUF4810 domain-containing protein n=1 Tax=Psychromonas arctica TaxID=168275 RepID=A0ABU9HAJ3_9GAMM